MVASENLKITTKRIGTRPSVLKLTLLDKDKKLVEVYAPGSFRELSEVERLKYEINKYLN
ncbi:hypothetical protein CNR22_18475 [Sphingobacteriaceae bacterium]|nr:hypothetical protein CNR22_18475 [Sphingobacteriaceae bacterium]